MKLHKVLGMADEGNDREKNENLGGMPKINNNKKFEGQHTSPCVSGEVLPLIINFAISNFFSHANTDPPKIKWEQKSIISAFNSSFRGNILYFFLKSFLKKFKNIISVKFNPISKILFLFLYHIHSGFIAWQKICCCFGDFFWGGGRVQLPIFSQKESRK